MYVWITPIYFAQVDTINLFTQNSPDLLAKCQRLLLTPREFCLSLSYFRVFILLRPSSLFASLRFRFSLSLSLSLLLLPSVFGNLSFPSSSVPPPPWLLCFGASFATKLWGYRLFFGTPLTLVKDQHSTFHGSSQGCDISSRVSCRTKRTNPIWICIWFGDTKFAIFP